MIIKMKMMMMMIIMIIIIKTLLILGLVLDPSPFYQTINIELPLWYTHIN